MNYTEFKEQKKHVEKAIRKLEREIEKLERAYIKDNFSFKVGDLVEFVHRVYPDDSYYGTDVYRCEKIKRIIVGEKGKIKCDVGNILTYVDIDKLKLFNPEDYTLRLKFTRDLKIGDKFILAVDKPKSTKGKIYRVHSKQEILDDGNYKIEYMYYNDYGKPQSLYEGEYVNHINDD